MKTAAALSALIARLAAAVGLEGAFLLAGTVLLAAAASYVSPAGPFFVVGFMCILAGIALAIPRRAA